MPVASTSLAKAISTVSCINIAPPTYTHSVCVWNGRPKVVLNFGDFFCRDYL